MQQRRLIMNSTNFAMSRRKPAGAENI